MLLAKKGLLWIDYNIEIVFKSKVNVVNNVEKLTFLVNILINFQFEKQLKSVPLSIMMLYCLGNNKGTSPNKN